MLERKRSPPAQELATESYVATADVAVAAVLKFSVQQSTGHYFQ